MWPHLFDPENSGRKEGLSGPHYLPQINPQSLPEEPRSSSRALEPGPADPITDQSQLDKSY